MLERRDREKMREEAERPVREAGGGEAEGFEEAEEALREQAEDTSTGRNPKYDAGEPEEERSSAVCGDADEVESSQTPDDDWN